MESNSTGAYTSEVGVSENGEVHEARLFHCSNSSGRFKVEEIPNFTQDDLISDDVMLLDLHHSVYVWVGNESNKVERQSGTKLAIELVAADGNRDKDTPIYRVSEGDEPPAFTAAFAPWTIREQFDDPYKRHLAELAAKRGDVAVTTASVMSPVKAVEKVTASDIAPAAGLTFTLAQLTDASFVLPDNCDPAKKETYLSDSEFQSAFNMSKVDFGQLAGWKQADAKKKAGLF
jgi:hypothetical protein